MRASRAHVSRWWLVLVPLTVGSPVEAAAWVSTGSMPEAREHHAAEVLADGNVLIVGAGFTANAAFLYDPDAGTFSTVGAMTVAPRRTGHRAARLANGKVLVAGGIDPSGGGVTLSSAQLFDPATGTFSATGNLIAARSSHTASALSTGKILVAGGEASFSALASCELYDPSAAAFSATGPLATARRNHVAVVLPNGKVLVAGGLGASGVVLASAALYDPVAGTWSGTGSLATARYLSAAVLLMDGRVLVAGGRGAGSVLLASAEIYDPSLGTWSPAGPLNAARRNHTMTTLEDGTVLVAGGGDVSGSAVPADPSTELFDPATEAFAPGPAMAEPRLFHTASLLQDGRVLVAGGEKPGQILRTSALFVPDPPLLGSIVLNEILHHEDPAAADPLLRHEWVEIRNAGAAGIDLAGFRVSDRSGRNGPGSRALPSVVLPAGASLVVHFASYTTDLDFTDGCGEYSTGDTVGVDLFAQATDEAALYGPSEILDFVAWNYGDSGYAGGTAHGDAVAAAQWPAGAFLDTARLSHATHERFRTVVPGSTLGRDRNASDTDLPRDWDAAGGRDAVGPTPCQVNEGRSHLVAADQGACPGPKAWTVLLYMSASNDLEKEVLGDLEEIEIAGGSDAAVNVVVMVDGMNILQQATLNAQNQLDPVPGTLGHTWRFQLGPHADARYANMLSHGYDPHLGEKNMGDPAVLSEFIAWGKQCYPAQKYALILWDHGQGWKLFGIEQPAPGAEPTDFLYMGELSTALAGQSFELIGFDACLMAMIEVAHQVQPFGRYMVASEEVVENGGWPYGTWLGALKTNPAMDGRVLGTNIVNAFDTYYAGPNANGVPRDRLRTISCIDLVQLPSLVTAVSGFGADLRNGVDDFVLHNSAADNVATRVRDDAAAAERFGDNNFMDLHHFTKLIRDDAGIPLGMNQCYKTKVPGVLDLSRVGGPVVVAEAHGDLSANAHGLSIHMPLIRTGPRDGAPGDARRCEEQGGTDVYDCPSWSRETTGSSRRAQYAPNNDCLPFEVEEVEGKGPLAAPAQWPLLPSPNLRFTIDTQWDEFLLRFYHPVSDNNIHKAVCPDGREIDPVIVDPVCGNPVDEITILPGCEVFFRGGGSSDADTQNRLAFHHMWDFDHLTSGCGACTAPYEVGAGVEADTADDDMNAEHDCSKAPLTDEKEIDAVTPSKAFFEIRDYIVTMHAWDRNHRSTFVRHDTTPTDDHVHPQTDDHISIVHLCTESSTPLPIQNGRFESKILYGWSADAASVAYDLVRGSLGTLRAGGGDFGASIHACLENDDTTDRQAVDSTFPEAGEGYYYLVRGVNLLGVPGTYDTGPAGQAAPRDAEIATSLAACP